MSDSGVAHKVISVIFRFIELASAVIVLAILSRFCYMISIAEVHADERIVYAMVVAGISIAYSIIFCVPFDIFFLGFPFDLILWVMWLVAYCLLQTKTTSGTCSSDWYYNYWGYYWGRFWHVGPIGHVDIGRAGCGSWRATLAFSFISSFMHLLSGILGIYVFSTYIHFKKTVQDVKGHAEKLRHKNKPDTYVQTGSVENGTNGTNGTQPVNV